jgi:hypothetical protein
MKKGLNKAFVQVVFFAMTPPGKFFAAENQFCGWVANRCGQKYLLLCPKPLIMCA